jgi:PAS domain S-box-containing protein
MVPNAAKFNASFEHAPIAILVADHWGCFVDANLAATSLLGYTRVEILDLSIPEVHPEESLIPALRAFQSAVEKGSSAAELLVRRKDGTCFRADVRMVRQAYDRVLFQYEDMSDPGHAKARDLPI